MGRGRSPVMGDRPGERRQLLDTRNILVTGVEHENAFVCAYSVTTTFNGDERVGRAECGTYPAAFFAGRGGQQRLVSTRLLLSARRTRFMPPEESDGTYARRVQDGDRDAFRVLIDRYEGMVFDLTHQYADTPEDAEDLAQDAFLRAFRRIEDLNNPDRFSSWLYGIALNRCRDYAKNVRRDTYAFSHTDDQEGADTLPGEHSPQDEDLVAEERSEKLWAALEELSSTYATPFLLKYRDGMTYKAMSKRLDVSVSALKVRVHRARKKLRNLLEARYERQRT